jgi:hypothetical protein
MSNYELPTGPEALSPSWFTDILRGAGVLGEGHVAELHVEPFAEGVGLLGRLVRVHLRYARGETDAPPTLVVKFPARAAENLALCEALRLYDREYGFYTTTSTETPLRVPRAYHAARRSPREFVLVLEDIRHAEPGNQLAGATETQIRTAVLRISEHHAAFWGRAQDGPRGTWLPAPDDADILGVVGALTRAGAEKLTRELPECFTDETRTVALTLADHMPALTRSMGARGRTFVHGDFRVDNLLFAGEGGTEMIVVDWQIAYATCAPYDVAYLMTQSVEPALRRTLEAETLAMYHDALCRHGVPSYSLEACREDYRRATTYCLCYPLIAAGTLDLSNARGRALGKMMLDRCLTAVSDAGSARLLRSLPGA